MLMRDVPLVALFHAPTELHKALWKAGYHPFLARAANLEELHHDDRLARMAIVGCTKDEREKALATVANLGKTLPVLDILAWAPRASGNLVRDLFRAGARDVLVTSGLDPVVTEVGGILDGQQILPRVDTSASRLPKGSRFESLWSRSPAMWDLFELCDRIAASDATVLIVGETGTGKELFARAIHRLSGRRGRFVSANCSSISPELIDSELFGHERGAFTGATNAKAGLVRHAEGGTLLLDEIGDMPPQSQVSILRMLQEKQVRPVGAQDELPVDVRVVAATNVSLEDAVENGEFREDLFYRLDVIRLTIPPLRDRREDILFLLGHFMRKLAQHYGRTPPRLSQGFLDAAMSFEWPGNVRQLENFAERVLLSTPRKSLSTKDFTQWITTEERADEATPDLAHVDAEPASKSSVDISKPLSEHLETLTRQLEVDYLTNALRVHQGRIQATAEAAGLSRRTLLRKLTQYGIDKRDFKTL